jgi:transposase
MDAHQQILTRWLGRLEALLARYWPEASSILEISSATLLKVLAHYGGPGPLVADPEGAARLARWGGIHLTQQKIEKLMKSAKDSVGVRQGAADLHQCIALRPRLFKLGWKSTKARSG